MFSMATSMVGLGMLTPLTLPLGLLMGRKALREDRERRLTMRRQEAKQALRRYVDEAQFAVGKDQRDTLRRVQRELRDRFQERALELERTLGEALTAAQQVALKSEAERDQRLRDVDAELERIDAAEGGRGARADAAHGPRRAPGLMGASLLEQVRRLLDDAIDAADGASKVELESVLARLDEPLRVAIAGRVKAGKSTLLNALVGEELAPTDAGECTKLVTWYQDGVTYRVTLESRSGAARAVPFHRDEGALEIDLGAPRPRRSSASSSNGRRRRFATRH